MRGAIALLMASLLVGAVAQNAPAVPATPPVSSPDQPAPAPAPVITRESQLQLPFDVPAEAVQVVLAQDLPAGASYIPGSSTLNGQPLPDPLVGKSGRLYWPIIPSGQGLLTYRVSHSQALGTLPLPALLAMYPRDRQEVLQGPFDQADYNAAVVQAVQGAENPGDIRLPLNGSVIRDRDRITVVVQGQTGAAITPSINGEPLPESALGQTDVDSTTGQTRLSYFGIRLKTGENLLTLGGEQIKVYYPGHTVRVQVQAIQALADGSTPLRFHLRALDENGLTTSQPTLTVNSSIEPSAPDADPNEGGYQVALKDGEGDLILPPQTAPSTLNLEFLVSGGVQRQSVAITPDVGTLGIGAASATLGLSGGQADFRWSAKGYFEGSLGGGKLFSTANKDGLPVSTNPTTRFPLYGDASSETVPLEGIDPVAFRYDHPNFSVQYRLSPTPVDVLPFGESITALSASSKGNFTVGGFVALLPGDQIQGERLIPNGTRLLHLAHSEVAPDSETLQLLTLEPGTGKELSRRTLVRYADYVLDPSSGVITLSGPLTPVDQNLNNVVVLASYRVVDGNTNRHLAYGAQAKYLAGPATFGVAAVSVDGKLTAGARASYATSSVSADALAMTEGGGFQLSGDLAGTLGATEFGAHLRYQDATYDGLSPFTVGTAASGLVRQHFSSSVTAELGADYVSTPTSHQGNVAARADYLFKPFSVGAGLKYSFGDQTGVSGIFGVGYHAQPFDLDITHSQPFSGNVDPETVFTARYAITPNVRLSVSDDLNWRSGQTASFGVDTTLGGTNFSVGYDLPNAAGSGNRARFGVDTSLPLGQGFTLGLRGAYTRDMTLGANDFSVGSDLRYQSATLSAALGGDESYSAGEWHTVLRAGATGALSDTFSLTGDALLQLDSTPGSRYTAGYAWRDGPWNSLGYLRFTQGSLAGDNPRLTAQFTAEYHQATWALRGGLDARMLQNDPGSLTFQPALGGTYYLNEYLGLGAQASALIQPASGLSTYGLGLEGSVRALPGTWLTLGYNILGYDGIGTTFTRPGPYIRLDLLLDENLGGHK